MSDQDFEEKVQKLLARPYHKVISGGPEEGYLGQVIELPGCLTDGETEEEALANLKEAMAGWFESALVHGDAIPEPKDETATQYGGRVLVRMPASLHKLLIERAEREGVSLNQWIVTVLALGSAGVEVSPLIKRTA